MTINKWMIKTKTYYQSMPQYMNKIKMKTFFFWKKIYGYWKAKRILYQIPIYKTKKERKISSYLHTPYILNPIIDNQAYEYCPNAAESLWNCCSLWSQVILLLNWTSLLLPVYISRVFWFWIVLNNGAWQ